MKVLILGAGPAGCAAAYFLKDKGISDISIVEKENLGGLCHTNFSENIPYEFGPQIMHTENPRIRKVFERFLTQHPPSGNDYCPACLVNGSLTEAHDFPVTFNNIMRLKHPTRIMQELYRINLQQPDYSNFENYVISRLGRILYEAYVKNYNFKHWKMPPRKMDAEWAQQMVFEVKEKPGLFPGRWQGHPGDYNPLWQGMVKGCDYIQGRANISRDFKTITINGRPFPKRYDLIISTLPLSEKLDFINTSKVFVLFKDRGRVMPSYANSFPNNFSFTRIIEYKQQYEMRSPYSLLSFAFSWKAKSEEAKYQAAVKRYCRDVLKREPINLWVRSKEKIYPISTKRNILLVNRILKHLANTNIIPLGRSGLHAYVSKDNCLQMAMTISDNLKEIMSRGRKKLLIMQKLRGQLR